MIGSKFGVVKFKEIVLISAILASSPSMALASCDLDCFWQKTVTSFRMSILLLTYHKLQTSD